MNSPFLPFYHFNDSRLMNGLRSFGEAYQTYAPNQLIDSVARPALASVRSLLSRRFVPHRTFTLTNTSLGTIRLDVVLRRGPDGQLMSARESMEEEMREHFARAQREGSIWSGPITRVHIPAPAAPEPSTAPPFLALQPSPRTEKQIALDTQLAAAFHANNWNDFHSLIDQGADPNIPNANGKTLLKEALERGKLEQGKILIDRGAIADEEDIASLRKLFADIGAQATASMEAYFIQRPVPDKPQVWVYDHFENLDKLSQKAKVVINQLSKNIFLLIVGDEDFHPNYSSITKLFHPSYIRQNKKLTKHFTCVRVLIPNYKHIPDVIRLVKTALPHLSWGHKSLNGHSTHNGVWFGNNTQVFPQTDRLVMQEMTRLTGPFASDSVNGCKPAFTPSTHLVDPYTEKPEGNFVSTLSNNGDSLFAAGSCRLVAGVTYKVFKSQVLQRPIVVPFYVDPEGYWTVKLYAEGKPLVFAILHHNTIPEEVIQAIETRAATLMNRRKEPLSNC